MLPGIAPGKMYVTQAWGIRRSCQLGSNSFADHKPRHVNRRPPLPESLRLDCRSLLSFPVLSSSSGRTAAPLACSALPLLFLCFHFHISIFITPSVFLSPAVLSLAHLYLPSPFTFSFPPNLTFLSPLSLAPCAWWLLVLHKFLLLSFQFLFILTIHRFPFWLSFLQFSFSLSLVRLFIFLGFPLHISPGLFFSSRTLSSP